MTQSTVNQGGPTEGLSRRSVMAIGAWSVPAIALAVAAPTASASVTFTATTCLWLQSYPYFNLFHVQVDPAPAPGAVVQVTLVSGPNYPVYDEYYGPVWSDDKRAWAGNPTLWSNVPRAFPLQADGSLVLGGGLGHPGFFFNGNPDEQIFFQPGSYVLVEYEGQSITAPFPTAPYATCPVGD